MLMKSQFSGCDKHEHRNNVHRLKNHHSNSGQHLFKYWRPSSIATSPYSMPTCLSADTSRYMPMKVYAFIEDLPYSCAGLPKQADKQNDNLNGNSL